MEWLDGNVATFAIAVIAGGGAMAWRIWALEKLVSEMRHESRENRQSIYAMLRDQEVEIRSLIGYLRGRGLVNGKEDD